MKTLPSIREVKPLQGALELGFIIQASCSFSVFLPHQSLGVVSATNVLEQAIKLKLLNFFLLEGHGLPLRYAAATNQSGIEPDR